MHTAYYTHWYYMKAAALILGSCSDNMMYIHSTDYLQMIKSTRLMSLIYLYLMQRNLWQKNNFIPRMRSGLKSSVWKSQTVFLLDKICLKFNRTDSTPSSTHGFPNSLWKVILARNKTVIMKSVSFPSAQRLWICWKVLPVRAIAWIV